ncbi:MAG TPA: hypothetical protein VIU61_29240 [Kofleriaceae bacterium]
MQLLRYTVALALAGCVQFDRPPEQRTPDAANPQPDAGGDAFDETLSQAAERVITTWQRCLALDDLSISGMASKWPKINTETGGDCASCHSTGGNGFLATTNLELLHSTLTTNRPYLLGYFTVDLTRGPAGAAMIVNTAVQSAVSQALPPYANHPRFDPAEGLSASETLRQIVQRRIDMGLCPGD